MGRFTDFFVRNVGLPLLTGLGKSGLVNTRVLNSTLFREYREKIQAIALDAPVKDAKAHQTLRELKATLVGVFEVLETLDAAEALKIRSIFEKRDKKTDASLQQVIKKLERYIEKKHPKLHEQLLKLKKSIKENLENNYRQFGMHHAKKHLDPIFTKNEDSTLGWIMDFSTQYKSAPFKRAITDIDAHDPDLPPELRPIVHGLLQEKNNTIKLLDGLLGVFDDLLQKLKGPDSEKEFDFLSVILSKNLKRIVNFQKAIPDKQKRESATEAIRFSAVVTHFLKEVLDVIVQKEKIENLNLRNLDKIEHSTHDTEYEENLKNLTTFVTDHTDHKEVANAVISAHVLSILWSWNSLKTGLEGCFNEYANKHALSSDLQKAIKEQLFISAEDDPEKVAKPFGRKDKIFSKKLANAFMGAAKAFVQKIQKNPTGDFKKEIDFFILWNDFLCSPAMSKIDGLDVVEILTLVLAERYEDAMILLEGHGHKFDVSDAFLQRLKSKMKSPAPMAPSLPKEETTISEFVKPLTQMNQYLWKIQSNTKSRSLWIGRQAIVHDIVKEIKGLLSDPKLFKEKKLDFMGKMDGIRLRHGAVLISSGLFELHNRPPLVRLMKRLGSIFLSLAASFLNLARNVFYTHRFSDNLLVLQEAVNKIDTPASNWQKEFDKIDTAMTEIENAVKTQKTNQPELRLTEDIKPAVYAYNLLPKTMATPQAPTDTPKPGATVPKPGKN